MNLNTPKYWNSVWGKYRKSDSKERIEAQVKNVIQDDFWKNKPGKDHSNYSTYKAWWLASKLHPKSILDVGCGNGRLLYGLKQILPKSELFGIDMSETAIKRMKDEYGINGKAMDIREMNSIKKKYDMVIFNDVLEHIEKEDEFLELCKNKIAKNGYLYGSIPNDILGPEETGEHLRKYTHKSVNDLFERYFSDYKIEIITIHIIVVAKLVT